MSDSNLPALWIRKRLPILLLFFAFLAVCNEAIRRTDPSSLKIKYQEIFHPRVDAQIVILGSSHAEYGVNPKYLENGPWRAYNFGSGGSPPSYFWDWYGQIFSRFYRKPAVALYCVH